MSIADAAIANLQILVMNYEFAMDTWRTSAKIIDAITTSTGPMLDGAVLLQSLQLATNLLISTSIGEKSIAVGFLNCQSPPNI